MHEELLGNLSFYLQPVPCTDGQVALSGAATQRVGMVRVCTAESWGKICGGSVDNNLAKVVCSQLGFPAYGKIFYDWNHNL